MKANEYIKKYGWICAGMKIAEIEHSKDFDGFYLDLKRIVESHELVEKMGGTMDELKEHVRVVERNLARSVYFKCTIERNIKRIDKIKQAIADVESCQ